MEDVLVEPLYTSEFKLTEEEFVKLQIIAKHKTHKKYYIFYAIGYTLTLIITIAFI